MVKYDFYSDIDEVASVHSGSVFVYSSLQEFMQGPMPSILQFTCCIYFIHILAWQACKRVLGTSAKHNNVKESFALTSAVINALLTIVGTLLFTSLPSNTSITERIIGLDHMNILVYIQWAFMFYSIPMGILVGEPKEMIVHHIALLYISFASGFVTNGCRYNTPFFFGIVECSSIPLAIMTKFNRNKELIMEWPKLHSVNNVVFTATFLTFRIFLWSVLWGDWAYIHLLLVWTSTTYQAMFIHSFSIAIGVLLTGLQSFWAYKIVRFYVKKYRKQASKHGAKDA